MDQLEEQERAAAALAEIRAHQERAERAARLPWWAYAAMFVAVAGVSSLNDFVDHAGAKVIGAVVLALFIVVVVAARTSQTSLLSRLRGVQPRRPFIPRSARRAYLAVVAAGVIAVWLIASNGDAFARGVGGAVGLRDYPYTVIGVIGAVVFTAMFALGHLLTRMYQRRARW
jgi:uncharacterized membrane protein YhaH (DUF805 family)